VKKGAVRLDRVVIAYANERVVHGVSLDVAPGEFVCLLGPSGCGKTTTLRAIAGLAGIESGTIAIDGAVANDKPAHERGIGMVFQDLALFPHMSVYRNIRFGLALRGVDEAAAQKRIAEMLELLRLTGLETRLPRQLSGGQQQRVALARSLVVNPSVLLLDEPFAALDRKLREDMRREIRALQREIGITTVFVTHDQEEALTMADRVVVMNKGVIEQVGSPSEVYEAPANRFVLSFVGYSNFLRAEDVREVDGELRARIAGAECALGPHAIANDAAGKTEIALRPERARLVADADVPPAHNRIEGTLRSVAYEGAMRSYDIVLADGQSLLVREQNTHRVDLLPARPVTVAWHPADGVLLR
jgi:ABC-type Fe3+/spermidine/putrescine transport system ATPase subunit